MLVSSVLSPIPELSKTCGVLMLPADRMTSLLAVIVINLESAPEKLYIIRGLRFKLISEILKPT